MKRCPQCEFIYEDDQSLCDMDGALLVFDSRSLPNLHALAPVTGVEVPVAPKAHWRHRTFPAMAALILATVFSLVYFVSTQRVATPSSPVNVPSVTLPASQLVAPATANPTPEPPPATEQSGAAPATKEESKPEATKAPAAPKGTSQATSKTRTTQSKPAEEPKKDDSKVGSILKKTGRILKKPFKF